MVTGDWFCDVCLSTAVKKLGGDEDMKGIEEAIQGLAGTVGFESGPGVCSRCGNERSQRIRFTGKKYY